MTRRIALLAAALVVALAGTTLIFSYLNRQPAAATQEGAASVLVATALIPSGTSGQGALDQGLVELTQVPSASVVPGALTDLTPALAQVAVADIQPGEQLLAAKFADPGTAGALPVPPELVAVTVQLDTEAQRVANFVKAGTEVAVFNTYDVTTPPPGVTPAGSENWPQGAAEPVVANATGLVVQRALVLAIGSTTVTPVAAQDPAAVQAAQPAPTAASLVTLAVTVEEAQELAQANQSGKLTLALLTDTSRTGTTVPDDNRTLLD